MGILFKRRKGISKENKFIPGQNNRVSSSSSSEGKIHETIKSGQISTEQKKIEEELIRSKKIAEKYLDLAGGIILSLDIDGNVTLLNRMGCEILGYPRDEIIGKNWFDYCIKPEFVPEIKGVFSKIFKGEMDQVEYFENEIVTRSGETRMIAWHNTVLKDDDGNITELLSSGMDISDLSKYQDELKKAKETLEDEVEKKTEELRLRVSELERFFDATVERELRVRDLQDELTDLKRENKVLVEQAGQKKGDEWGIEGLVQMKEEKLKGIEERKK